MKDRSITVSEEEIQENRQKETIGQYSEVHVSHWINKKNGLEISRFRGTKGKTDDRSYMTILNDEWIDPWWVVDFSGKIVELALRKNVLGSFRCIEKVQRRWVRGIARRKSRREKMAERLWFWQLSLIRKSSGFVNLPTLSQHFKVFFVHRNTILILYILILSFESFNWSHAGCCTIRYFRLAGFLSNT